jgi:hypothetical protein
MRTTADIKPLQKQSGMLLRQWRVPAHPRMA